MSFHTELLKGLFGPLIGGGIITAVLIYFLAKVFDKQFEYLVEEYFLIWKPEKKVDRSLYDDMQKRWSEEREKRIIKDQKLESRNEELTEKEQKLEKKKEEISQIRKVQGALSREGFDKEKLVDKLREVGEDIPIIFLSIGRQRDSDGKKVEEGDNQSWLLKHFYENYNAKKLTYHTKIIPPSEVPDKFRNSENRDADAIEDWLKSEIPEEFSDWQAVVSFASVQSFSDVYSGGINLDFDEGHLRGGFRTLKSVLDYDEIMKEKDFDTLVKNDKVSFKKLIESGDVGFLAADFISSSELDKLHEEQDEIEEAINQEIGNGEFDLNWMAKEGNQRIIEEAIRGRVEDPEGVSEKIVDEASFWQDRIEEVTGGGKFKGN